MNNKSPAAIFTVLIFAFSQQIMQSQEQSEIIGNFEKLPKLPKQARWVVSISVRENPDSVPPPKYVTKIEINRTPNLRRDIMTWSDGKTTERWFVSNKHGRTMMVEDRDDTQDTAIRLIEIDSYTTEQMDDDFPELGWISPENFRAEKKINGRVLWYFETEKTEENRITYKAYIDPKNRLPVSHENDLFLFEYSSFSQPEPLSLPQRFQEKFEEYRRIVAQETTRRMLLP